MYNYFLMLLVCETMQKKKLRILDALIKSKHQLNCLLFICYVRSGGGLLSYMGHIGMCRCEGYGFQSVYSSMHRVYK